MAQTTVPFTASTTWNVPAGVTSITIECWGGGGGGGGCRTLASSGAGAAGGGGGGGAYSTTTVSVTPGQLLTIAVGAAGAAGASGSTSGGNHGGDGGTSSVNTTLGWAAGGIGGRGIHNGGNAQTGTTAGGSTGSGTVFSGGTGSRAVASGGTGKNGGAGGGGAGSTANGSPGETPPGSGVGKATALIGGNGGTSGGGKGGNGGVRAGAATGSSVGIAAVTIGGGGGGGVAVSSGSAATAVGGAGTRGEVRITYIACISPTALTYTSNTITYCGNTAIASNTPSFTGSSATSYAVSPALPSGLALSTTTGIISGTPTAATAAANYTVTVTNSCGSNTKVLNITVVVADAGADKILCGGTVQIGQTANTGTVPILTQDFESGIGSWTTQNTSTGGTPASASWTVQPSPTSGVTSGSQFNGSNSNLAGNGNTGNTMLQSPAFSTVGFTTLSVTFKHYFATTSDTPPSFNDVANVEVSTNGTSWTTVQSWTTNQGTASSFASATVNLNAYINNPTLYLRFRYQFSWDYLWCVDDIVIGGQNVTYAWTGPAGSVFSASSTISDPSVNLVGTYTLTVNGCAATDDVIVSGLGVVVARTPTGPQFTGTEVTFTATPSGGTGSYDYVWTTSPVNASIAATPSTGALQSFTTILSNSDAYNVSPPSPSITVTCTVTDQNGCSGSGGLSPAVYPAIQAPQGTLTRCPGAGTTQLTTGTCMLAASGTTGYSGFNWTISPAGAGSISNAGLITWNSGFTGDATASVYAVGAASSATVGTQNSGTRSVIISVSSAYTAPTSVTGAATLCHGGSTTLTSTGGTLGTGVDTWYDGACSNAFEQNWDVQPYALGSTTVNSNTGGILNLTSTTSDPMLYLTSLGSFDPVANKYVHIRYRVLSGTAGTAELFFLNTTNTGPNQSYAVSGGLISDGSWHVLNIDMSANANWVTGGNITGFRYDWAGNNNVQMELDFFSLSANNILATGSTYTVSPTATTTYYVNRTGSCGATGCISHTVTLPVAGTTLSGNESATCAVSGNNWIHFYNTSSGKLIVSINPNGNNLGNVTATSFVDGAAILTQTCGTGTNPLYTTAAMGRRWTISPEFQPGTPVSVKFPFGSTELSSLVTASAGTSQNAFDNVTTASNLKLSKYSGINQDGAWGNNCLDGGTILVLNQAGQGALTAANGYLSTFPSSTYVQFSIPGFSEFWLHNAENSSPLPVQLTNFSATCQASAVDLSWSTASEQNAQKFLVQKSRDMIHWIQADDIAAVGNSSSNTGYSSSDPYPFDGISYYRLVQADNNGMEKVFGPISVSCADNENSMAVFPNPAQGSFTIEISSAETCPAEVQLTDVTGKIVSSRKIQLTEGNMQVLCEGAGLNAGTYIIRLISENNHIKPVKIVIQ